jgi:hypothetical protein
MKAWRTARARVWARASRSACSAEARCAAGGGAAAEEAGGGMGWRSASITIGDWSSAQGLASGTCHRSRLSEGPAGLRSASASSSWPRTRWWAARRPGLCARATATAAVDLERAGEAVIRAGLGDRCGEAGLGDRCGEAGLGDRLGEAGLGDRFGEAGLGDRCGEAGLGDRLDRGGGGGEGRPCGGRRRSEQGQAEGDEWPRPGGPGAGERGRDRRHGAGLRRKRARPKIVAKRGIWPRAGRGSRIVARPGCEYSRARWGLGVVLRRMRVFRGAGVCPGPRGRSRIRGCCGSDLP